ncbi:TIGR02678 family protein [Micromonospora sp. NBC_00898]|uniref:TIGR02678 family protein n=1 Tax=Micromonospora sp. NBC_00898 TaxID=2975981 RepID=UPI0038683A5D|nr:TIGR02678 family protein [Micromonospora sp. NBC_00898]
MSGATGTASQSARERQDAARALLARPLLTAAHAEELSLVRLHAPALRSVFKTTLGYHLVVESTFARLTKRPISADGPARPARRADGSAFTPVTYTHLALLCAALLAPGTGEQILISALIEQVRSDAATIGVRIGDTLPERRALVTAIGHLIGWGVLSETDGTAGGWGERRDEALLTLHRAALPHLLARPLSGMEHTDDLLAEDPQTADQPRRSLRRKLVENPLVRREDLTDAERDVLSRERTELTRVLADNFGLTLEVRAEGALAYDTAGSLTDVTFPGSGRVKQAALLLLGELIDACTPTAGASATLDDGRAVPGLAVKWSEVEATLASLTNRHAKAWGEAIGLRDEALAVLTGMGLARPTPEGIVVHPAAARYRPRPQSAPPTRAARRLADQLELEMP